MRPKVMLFDEVTSALVPELCGEVLNVIRRLGEAHNLTMLMVTHQMGFAREFADRVCFFHQGRIHEQGSPDELFSNPQEERTREFLSAALKRHTAVTGCRHDTGATAKTNGVCWQPLPVIALH